MLIPTLSHSWGLTPQEAVALQRELATRVDPRDYMEAPGSVAGIDVGIKGGVAHAAVVVLSLPALQPVEWTKAERPVPFPYVPGLLSFREAPVILEALARLKSRPDLLMVDGQGYAHPRRMGIATHLGILLDHPTIGCAKSRLCGSHAEPDTERGSFTWLYDGSEIIGVVLRTRRAVKPVYVSVGNKISLESAMRCTMQCCTRYRLPEPIRWAHRQASQG